MQDSDCVATSGYGCANNQSFYPEHNPFCDNGSCHDWSVDCDNACQAIGSMCAGVLYTPCSQ